MYASIGGSCECCAVVAGAFYEGIEVYRGVGGEPSCAEVRVPCVVYENCVCVVGLREFSVFGCSGEEYGCSEGVYGCAECCFGSWFVTVGEFGQYDVRGGDVVSCL